MAQAASGGNVVSLQEMVLAQMFESEALLNVLERQGVIRKADVLEEITRLRETSVKAR